VWYNKQQQVARHTHQSWTHRVFLLHAQGISSVSKNRQEDAMIVDLRVCVTICISLEYLVPQMAEVVASIVLAKQPATKALPALRELVRRARSERGRRVKHKEDVDAASTAGQTNTHVDEHESSSVGKLRAMNDATCALAKAYVATIVETWSAYVLSLHRTVCDKTKKLDVECTKTKMRYNARHITAEVYERTIADIATELRVFVEDRVRSRVSKPVVERSAEFVKVCDDLRTAYAASFMHLPTSTIVSLKDELYARIASLQRVAVAHFVSAIREVVDVRT